MLCFFTCTRINVPILVTLGSFIMPSNYDNRSCKFILKISLLITFRRLRKLKSQISTIGLKFKYLCIFAIKFCWDISEASIIIDFANINHKKVIYKILPKNKKYPIVFLSITQSLSIAWWNWWPKIPISIRSSSNPLLLSPRITQFQYPIRSLINTKLNIIIFTIVYAWPLTNPYF